MENKLNIEELNQLIDLTIADLNRDPRLRAGQALFNNLYSLYPIVADHIRGMYGLDPFYNDRFITSCLAFIIDDNGLKVIKNIYSNFVDKTYLKTQMSTQIN